MAKTDATESQAYMSNTDVDISARVEHLSMDKPTVKQPTTSDTIRTHATTLGKRNKIDQRVPLGPIVVGTAAGQSRILLSAMPRNPNIAVENGRTQHTLSTGEDNPNSPTIVCAATDLQSPSTSCQSPASDLSLE